MHLLYEIMHGSAWHSTHFLITTQKFNYYIYSVTLLVLEKEKC